MDDVICPICCEVLIEKKGFFVCSKGHYKTETTFKIKSEPLPENLYKFDLFESLYAESDIDIPNEFRTKLQEVMNTIKEEHKHILLTYVEEGCINSTRHLSHKAMSELCTIYKTSSENIRQIKKRTLDKIKKHCFAKNK
jgi:PHD/YefM family antitoxin component YafN of YafNO toxin-antitoxin module